jgi:DNA-binding NarL/FixJ family response regulator
LDRRLAELSAAEREVFDLVRRGLSNKEIAAERGRSVATVKNQLQSVLQKFGVSSRMRLIAWTR